MKKEEQDVLLLLERGLRQLVIAGEVSEPVSVWATTYFVTLDTLRAAQLAVDATEQQQRAAAAAAGTSNVFTVGPERRAVLDWALAECLRVRSLAKRVDPAIYWAVAAPGVRLSAAELKEKSWCGGFALCAVKSAGFGHRTVWDFFGKGMAASIYPAPKGTEAPGDIAYFDQPNQHYALIEALDAETYWLINGNSTGNGVVRNAVKRSSVSHVYSIDRMLRDPAPKSA